MPKLVTLASICVIRDSKRVFPEIGKAFDYTNEEVQRIRAVSPTALRKPVNEDDSPVVGDEFETPPIDKTGETEGGKKAAEPTANKAPKKTAKQKAAEKTADPAAADDESDDVDEDEDGDI